MLEKVQVPSDFIECLREHVTGFSDESPRAQMGLAIMAWVGSEKRRQHRGDPRAMSFTSKELSALFGRNAFDKIFRRVNMFTRSPGWNHGKHTTRAYRFGEHGAKAVRIYRDTNKTDLVDLRVLSGSHVKTLRTLPSAISSYGTNGTKPPTQPWACAKQMNRVPVNTIMLQALLDLLTEYLTDPGIDPSFVPIVTRYTDTAARLLRMSQTTLAGPNQLAQAYSISPSGRLYATGVNLQNAPSLIKEASLHGLWEYDIANCHFAIVAQLARKAGTPCTIIEHYMLNKELVRREIASDVCISIDLVKQCLLALLYGAKTILSTKAAIPSAIGIDAAKGLYANEQFHSLSLEIDLARTTILSNWPRTANGSLTNASRRAIAKSKTDKQKLAHLVQGIEAEALRIIVTQYPKDIVLLQHDGFVSRRPLDRAALQEKIAATLGHDLILEECQLQAHPDITLIADRMKTEIAREAASVLDFADSDAY